MDGHAKSPRTDLSYLGAIKPSNGTPTQYKGEKLGKSHFDPGTSVYISVLDIIYGSDTPWHIQTKCDIIESLLVDHWLCEVQTQTHPHGHAHSGLRNVCMMSQILNFVVGRAYRLITCFAHVDPIALRAAFRCIMNTEPSIPTKRFGVPKPKLLGDATFLHLRC